MHTFDKSKLFFLTARATVAELDVPETHVREAIEFAIAKQRDRMNTAEVDPVGPNQQPRMLQISAFILHADEMNENRVGFTLADLEEVVSRGMFKAPYFGMIDYNHDFTAYGAWYDASLQYDPQTSSYGILAKGAIFAWRYEDLANRMLAQQVREGSVAVSMACMPGFYEPGTDRHGGEGRWARKPVFFTTSVLDVPPADPHARGLVAEDPNNTNEDRAVELLAAALAQSEETMDLNNETPTEVTPEPQEPVVAEQEVAPVEPEPVEPEPVTEVATEEPVAEVTPEEPVVPETAEEAPPEAEAPVAEAAAPEVAELEALRNEVQTLTVALNAAKTEIATLTDEVSVLRAFKAEIDTTAREAELAARREARLAQIPESVRVEMAKDENAALLDEWMAMDEARWEATLNIFTVATSAPSKKSFADRTAAEGTLVPAGAEVAENGFAITRWTRKRP